MIRPRNKIKIESLSFHGKNNVRKCFFLIRRIVYATTSVIMEMKNLAKDYFCIKEFLDIVNMSLGLETTSVLATLFDILYSSYCTVENSYLWFHIHRIYDKRSLQMNDFRIVPKLKNNCHNKV